MSDKKSSDRAREWRRRNADKVKTYRLANKERQRIYKIGNRQKNSEKIKAYSKEWCKKNRDKRALYEHKRRAIKKGLIEHYTIEQVHDLYSKQKAKCICCICSIKSGYHVDHIVPLSKGGKNDISNIQLLCQPCNSRKHAKDPIEWARQNARLI